MFIDNGGIGFRYYCNSDDKNVSCSPPNSYFTDEVVCVLGCMLYIGDSLVLYEKAER